ncbi:glycosyltransferase [Corynascus novoguineensis]|uniref:N-acetylgalactosaminide beta-1,3-galactosyltransferase n=1 Tax=Corynascus novoguineensis TaxID=1126955 RepID=A0AAN7CUE4_9PEZI|nr:glycosyltransferase [Corynascus novoguineensis]
MIITHKNNRLVPAIIITACLWATYYLIDSTVNNFSDALPVSGWSSSQLDDLKPTPTSGRETTSVWLESASSKTAAPSTITLEESRIDQHAVGGNLTAADVLLIVKTGSTSMWKRLLVHLTTTLSPQRIPPENAAIYSDYSETIGNVHIIDALANVTTSTKALTDFDVYRQNPEYANHNVYVEAAGVDGDNYGPPGGWIIDKYKFLPLIQHAGENWPKVKWYIYMEDDAYLFLPNVLAYLSAFDSREPHYLGSYAAKSDIIFAHGGAGFALSRGAWEKTFGHNPNLSVEYEAYTAFHCCGDQVLGHALNKHGVRFGENGGDEKFTWGFNPIVHWRFGFSRWNWCSPLMSWHKVHNRDVARYFAFENTWDFTKPLLHRDFFIAMIAPNLEKRAEWWDNQSGLFKVTSANKASPPIPETDDFDMALWKEAWASEDACEAACESWASCVQWSYVEDLCSMDDKVMMGQGYAPAMSERKTALKTTSGWLKERLNGWNCT